WPEDRRIVYIADLAATWGTDGLVIEVATEQRDPNGGWRSPVQFRLGHVWHHVPDAADKTIMQRLVGALPQASSQREVEANHFLLRGAAVETTLQLICETGRCRVRRTRGERPTETATWDNGPPWKFHLRITRSADGYELGGVLLRNGEEMSL